MGKITEGAKAGTVAGIIYGIMATTVTVSLEYVFRNGIISAIVAKLPENTTNVTATNLNVLYYSTIVGSIFVGMIFAIVLGLVLGIIFGTFSDRIPGKKFVVKGLVLGFLSWIIIHLFADVLNLRYGLVFYIAAVSLGLITSLSYGALLGLFFERAMKRKTRHQYASRA